MGWKKGMKHSEESKKKISQSRKGQNNNPLGNPKNLKPHPRVYFRSSRRLEDRANRYEWMKLQRSLRHINIESREEELARLIREQEIDDRTYQIKHNPGLQGKEDETYRRNSKMALQ